MNKFDQEIKQLAQSGIATKESPALISKMKSELLIGVPKEIVYQEHRVSLSPLAVKLLVENEHNIIVESGAGDLSNFIDKDYSDAGAVISYDTKAVFAADILLKVEPPNLEEIAWMNDGATLISTLQLGNQNKEYFESLNLKNITAISYETLEDAGGGIPLVRAMSEIAGSMSMMVASKYLGSGDGQMGILLGGVTGVRRANVMILGAGTVAEYAARVALGLGCEVKVLDNHVYKLRRLNNILGNTLFTGILDNETITHCLRHADVVIGAVRFEKGKRQCFVSKNQVAMMKQNAVIIDVSIDNGGCFETSKITSLDQQTYRVNDVIHCCIPNITSMAPQTASMAISNVLTPMLLKISEEGGVENMMRNYRWFLKGIYTHKGNITQQPIARKFGFNYVDISFLFPSTM